MMPSAYLNTGPRIRSGPFHAARELGSKGQGLLRLVEPARLAGNPSTGKRSVAYGSG